MTTALEIFENGFDDYEKREYALEGPQTGSAEGQLYFFWPEDVAKIRKALSPTPPPVDGDLAQAIAYLRLAVFDTKKAFDSLEIIIQAATSQQAREWSSEELVDIGRKAIHEARNANNGYAPLGERALAGAVVKALAAKNIIRLKDGGAE